MADGDAPPDDRRLTDAETALILRRATEAELRLPARPEGGHTVEELAAIAGEAGIDPAAVRLAARLHTPHPDTVRRAFLGAPSHGYVRARFPGRLPDARVGEARSVIESRLQSSGELHHDATGFLWREDHGVGRTYVRLHREAGATDVEVEVDRRGHLLALVVVLATLVAVLLQPLGGFVGLTRFLGPLLAFTAPVATVALATRLCWPSLARPAFRRAEAATMELGALVRPPEADTTRGGAPEDAPPGPVE